MSEATRHTDENDTADWRDLADQIFPADALRTAPTVHPQAVV
jgi:hypothetical protein